MDLSQCIIILTSNLGASEMTNLVDGGFGFAPRAVEVDNDFDDKIQRTAVEAARRKFTPEFMNRIDKTVVFKTLRDEHLSQILEIELGMVQQRILMARERTSSYSIARRMEAILAAGRHRSALRSASPEARHRAEHGFPLANLVATGQVKLGDFVRVDMASENQMIFVKEAENTMAPVLSSATEPQPPICPPRARRKPPSTTAALTLGPAPSPRANKTLGRVVR